MNREGKYGLQLDYSYDADGHPDNFYCRSDHYMYARYGIPIAFFSTGGHRDYHQVTDEAQYLDFAQYATVTRYVADLALRLAALDHRPVVDRPKPDPEAPCRQSASGPVKPCHSATSTTLPRLRRRVASG